MTAEVRYIIENKKFKRTWGDYLAYAEFIYPALSITLGLSCLFEGKELKDYLIGTLLLIGSFALIKFLLVRSKQLNGFETIKNERTKKQNFEHCLQGLKNLNIVEVDRDVHNWTIDAKHKATMSPPGSEWLTIVCRDNEILVNSRPAPITLIMWWGRNAFHVFMKRV